MTKAVPDYIDIAKILILEGANIEAKDNNDDTSLSYTSLLGCADTAKVLVEMKANIESKNKDGDTPLIIKYAEGNIDIAKMLILEGANIEAKDNNGDTSLIVASRHARTNIANMLIEMKADIESKNKDGYTALHTCVNSYMYSYNDSSKIARTLIEKRANPFVIATDEAGLDRACMIATHYVGNTNKLVLYSDVTAYDVFTIFRYQCG